MAAIATTESRATRYGNQDTSPDALTPRTDSLKSKATGVITCCRRMLQAIPAVSNQGQRRVSYFCFGRGKVNDRLQ